MRIHSQLSHLANHHKYLEFKDLVRQCLRDVLGYTEVEVPTLSPVIIPEGYLGIFRTELDFFGDKDPLFLTPHPEIFLKRLLVAVAPSVFSISRSYRNHEGTTQKHSPEFDMLEFYKVRADYNQLAQDVLTILQYVCKVWYGGLEFVYRNKCISLDSWEVMTVAEAFARYAGVTDVFDHEKFFLYARELGYTVEGFGYTEVFSQVYTDRVEPHLGTQGRPTIIKDYPQELGATARWNRERGVAERWEFYIEGIELGNAANEQADHLSQGELQAKYQSEMVSRERNKLTPIIPDLEFPNILTNIPPCSGIGMGLERLCAIMLDLTDIRELKVSWVE